MVLEHPHPSQRRGAVLWWSPGTCAEHLGVSYPHLCALPSWRDHWCHPSAFQLLSPSPECSQNANGNKGWEGLSRTSSVPLGGRGWDSFSSSMQRILLETELEFLRPEERLAWAEELCKLPALSRLGFSLRRHTVCSSLMVRVKQEHLLMKR